jgi:opacity protein-like surface antigen
MKLKQVLLASAALALLSYEAQADGLYISVFGGANFQPDQSDSIPFGGEGTGESFTMDPDTGFVIGGVVGTKLTNWAKGLRVELEAGYRRNDVGGRWTTSSGSTGGFIDANQSTFSIMANAWYDIDIGSKVRPYVGGGVGWARTRGEFAFISTFFNLTSTTYSTRSTTRYENSGFAWQLGLGFNYEVAPDVDVGIGYRYFVGPRISDSGSLFFVGNTGALDNDNHAVQVNLTIGIN